MSEVGNAKGRPECLQVGRLRYEAGRLSTNLRRVDAALECRFTPQTVIQGSTAVRRCFSPMATIHYVLFRFSARQSPNVFTRFINSADQVALLTNSRTSKCTSPLIGSIGSFAVMTYLASNAVTSCSPAKVKVISSKITDV